jgi:hypothetical protein
MSSFTVTATTSGVGRMALAVTVLTGAAETQPGSTGADGAASLSITPAASGSIVYGAAMDVAGNWPATPVGSATFIANSVDSTREFALLRSADVTVADTPVTLGMDIGGSTVPAIALCEILASGTLAEDASSPAPVPGNVNNDSFFGTSRSTAAFDPPPGSLLVVMAASSGGAGGDSTITITDTSGLGLTWVDQVHLGDFDSPVSVAVFTAQMPGGDPPLVSSQTLTLTANTETHLESTDTRYNLIEIENQDPSAVVWVACDGTTATVAGDGCLAVLPGETLGFGNLLALGNAGVPGEVPGDGWTAQQFVVDPAVGYLTYISLISSGTPSVTVTVC